MRRGTILAALFVCLLTSVGSCTADTTLRVAVRRLYSSSPAARSQAVKELVSHGASAIPAVKAVLCNKSAKGFDVAWPSAAAVAGELRAKETVLCLLPLLAWNIPPGVGNVNLKSNETLIDVDPAFAALLRIGEPAVPAIRFYLPFMHPTQVDMTMRILQTIGTPSAKEAAEHYLKFLEDQVEWTKKQIQRFRPDAAQ